MLNNTRKKFLGGLTIVAALALAVSFGIIGFLKTALVGLVAAVVMTILLVILARQARVRGEQTGNSVFPWLLFIAHCAMVIAIVVAIAMVCKGISWFLMIPLAVAALAAVAIFALVNQPFMALGAFILAMVMLVLLGVSIQNRKISVDTLEVSTLIAEDVDVEGDVDVDGNINVSGNANVDKDINIGGNANIDGDANISGNANIDGDVVVGGDIITTNPPESTTQAPTTTQPSKNEEPATQAPTTTQPSKDEEPTTQAPTTTQPSKDEEPTTQEKNPKITCSDSIRYGETVYVNLQDIDADDIKVSNRNFVSVEKISDSKIAITLTEDVDGYLTITDSKSGTNVVVDIVY